MLFNERRFSPDEVIAERDAARYEKAVEAYQKNNYLEALTLLNSVSEGYEQSADMIAEILKMLQSTPAAGGKDFYALRNLDGTVSLTGSGWKGETVSWSGIRSIAVGRENFILGLRANGTVAAAGKSSYDRTGVGSWTNIVQVACGLNPLARAAKRRNGCRLRLELLRAAHNGNLGGCGLHCSRKQHELRRSELRTRHCDRG